MSTGSQSAGSERAVHRPTTNAEIGRPQAASVWSAQGNHDYSVRVHQPPPIRYYMSTETTAITAIPRALESYRSQNVSATWASLDPEKGQFVDDITYSSVDGPSVFTHPLCPNTWRNGTKLGDEQKAQGY
jgi:hypothetical protein